MKISIRTGSILIFLLFQALAGCASGPGFMSGGLGGGVSQNGTGGSGSGGGSGGSSGGQNSTHIDTLGRLPQAQRAWTSPIGTIRVSSGDGRIRGVLSMNTTTTAAPLKKHRLNLSDPILTGQDQLLRSESDLPALSFGPPVSADAVTGVTR